MGMMRCPSDLGRLECIKCHWVGSIMRARTMAVGKNQDTTQIACPTCGQILGHLKEPKKP